MWQEYSKRQIPYLVKDSRSRKGISIATITQFSLPYTKIYAGVKLKCWLHAPKQYEPSQAACLIVFAYGYNYVIPDKMANLILDNLFDYKDIPVTHTAGTFR